MAKKIKCIGSYCLEAQRKLLERGKNEEVVKEISIYPQCVELGPFSVSFLPVSHSIPESSGLIIKTDLGKVFHTGDFKLDKTPILGDPYDPSLWKAACVDLDVLVCDSTNVLVTQPAKSEKSLRIIFSPGNANNIEYLLLSLWLTLSSKKG